MTDANISRIIHGVVDVIETTHLGPALERAHNEIDAHVQHAVREAVNRQFDQAGYTAIERYVREHVVVSVRG